MTPRIEVRGLTKRYGATLSVDDLSFTVNPGTVTGFLGPNGAGKSTTMRVLLGLDAPTAGTATVGGRRFTELPAPLREVGALLDARAVHGSRTAYHHLLCLAQSNGIPRSRVHEVLGLVGLEPVAGKRTGTFSLGMSQRLGIAAALLGDPPVLLFDEPVNGLDPEGIRWVRRLMRGLAAEGRTVLVSSHLISEMSLTADHLVIIGRGRLIADTTVEDFLRRDDTGSVLVRTPEAGSFARVLRAEGATVTVEAADTLDVTGLTAALVGKLGAREGIELHELTPRTASLEDAFMELTRDSITYGVTEENR